MSRAFSFTNSILTNSGYMLIAYPVFFVFAVLIWRKTRAEERKIGNTMLLASIPGMIFAVTAIVCWAVAFGKCYSLIKDGSFVYTEFHSKNKIFYNIPSNLAVISTIICPILCVMLFISGRMLMKKEIDKKFGKTAAVVGGISAAFFILMLLILLALGGLI